MTAPTQTQIAEMRRWFRDRTDAERAAYILRALRAPLEREKEFTSAVMEALDEMGPL